MMRKHNGMKRLTAAVFILLLLTTMAVPAAVAETFSAIVTAGEMMVYKDARLQAQAGALPKDTIVRVKAYSGKAAKISWSGKTGYAPVSALKAVDDVAKKAVVNADAKVYSLPGGEGKSAEVKKGTKVYVLSWSGKWAQVEKGGKVGYMKLTALSKADDNWQTAEDRAATATVAPDATIAPTETPSTENAEQATVTSKKLNIYKTASTKAKKVATARQGDALNVLRWNNKWAYVELNGKYGFCNVSGIARAGDADATASPSATPSVDQAITAAVSADSVTIYLTASESAEALGTLMWGEQVNVLSVTDGWAYVERNGKFGFCKKSALTKTDADPDASPTGYKKAKFNATVVFPDAKVYETASTSSRAKKIKLGKEVKVTSYSRNLEWACVTNGKTRGFIPVKHLSKAKYADINSGGSALQTLLKALLAGGYYDGIPTTNYNTSATTAIQRFQAACGLQETGIADQTLQRILYAGYAPQSPLLSKSMNSSSSGADVKRVQLRLYALGYLSKAESIDSRYGATTATAVGLFQRSNKIDVTCVADTATLKAIYSTAAVSRPDSVKAADDGGSISVGEVVTPQGTVKLSSTYVTVMPEELKSTTSSYSESMSSGQKLEHVIYAAQEKLGKPYVYGSTGPNSFDCSGLSTYAFRQVSVSLKRSAYSQGYDSGYDKIEGVGNLKRGDLVFFNTISDSDLSDHVGIYLGGGCFIHASSGGHKVVVSNLTTGFYNRVFSWGRRILK